MTSKEPVSPYLRPSLRPSGPPSIRPSFCPSVPPFLSPSARASVRPCVRLRTDGRLQCFGCLRLQHMNRSCHVLDASVYTKQTCLGCVGYMVYAIQGDCLVLDAHVYSMKRTVNVPNVFAYRIRTAFHVSDVSACGRKPSSCVCLHHRTCFRFFGCAVDATKRAFKVSDSF